MIKTTLATPDNSDEFVLKEYSLLIHKDRNKPFEILYVKGILYPNKYKDDEDLDK